MSGDAFPVYAQSDYAAKWEEAHGYRCRTDARDYGRYRATVKDWMIDNRAPQCEECGVKFTTKANARKALVVHHVLPVAQGGTDVPENLVLLCGDCHQENHNFRLGGRAIPGYTMGMVAEPGKFRGIDLTQLSDDEAAAIALPSPDAVAAKRAARASAIADAKTEAAAESARRTARLLRWRAENGWKPRRKRKTTDARP